MIDINFRECEVMTIDLHNMQVWEAEQYLNQVMDTIPQAIREVVVIHGYHRGTKLMNYVRYEFKSKRVYKKFLCINNGRTSLILQPVMEDK